ncbi:MAG: hydroxyethylthiazole kinase [Pseudomonadota bacterium]
MSGSNAIVTASATGTGTSPEGLGQSLATMRAAVPLVHNITNYVAMNFQANVMLAAGASPAMIHAREEAADFAAIASALTINIGTLSPAWLDAMLWSAEAARDAGRPWVLDPVAVGATQYRRQAGGVLLARRPRAIRSNASEVIALAGIGQKEADGAGSGRGADATDTVHAAEEAARALAQRSGAVVAVTGAEDFVTDGTRAVLIYGGSPIMPLITAMGCSLTGLSGAFLAAVDDPFDAMVGACALFSVAGARAGRAAAGPGSFQMAFLDHLHTVTPEDLADEAQVVSA